MNLLTPITIAAITSATLVLSLRPLARRIGLVDRPGERKAHEGAVPLVGGIAMFLGFTFAVLLLDVPLSGLRALFLGAALLVVVGVLDDFHELSASSRFLGQILAALVMSLWGGVVLLDFGHLFTTESLLGLGLLAVPWTVFSTVGVINALNMSDGLDGLSGSIALVALMSLVWIAASAGQGGAMAVLLVASAAVFGFLLFNWRIPGRRQAMVFMGDAGSMWLGFLLTWFLITLSQGEGRAMTPVTALWILALPLFDTISVMIRRIGSKRSPFDADHEHLHHAFLRAGFTVTQTVAIETVIAAAFAAFGLWALHAAIPEPVMFYSFAVVSFLYLVVISRAWKTRRWLGKAIK